MRKLTFALIAVAAMTFAGLASWKAEATIFTGALPTQNYSQIEKVGCSGPGPRCPWGRTWLCGPRGCWCAPCGGYYAAPYVHPLRPWRWRY
jgi:hypothetical protein